MSLRVRVRVVTVLVARRAPLQLVLLELELVLVLVLMLELVLAQMRMRTLELVPVMALVRVGWVVVPGPARQNVAAQTVPTATHRGASATATNTGRHGRVPAVAVPV